MTSRSSRWKVDTPLSGGNGRFSGHILGLKAGVWFAGLLVAAPLLSLVLIAITGTPSVLGHTLLVTLPMTARDTIWLLAGVTVVATVLGLSTAWIVSLFDFPGRRILSVALAMPLAVPTYLVAYVYAALLDAINPGLS